MLGDKEAVPTVAVRDLAAAKKFYSDTLGLKPLPSPEKEVLNFKNGSSELLVYQSQFAGTNKATAVTWNVDDVEKATRELQSQGYRILVRARKEPWGQVVTRLLGPEGVLVHADVDAGDWHTDRLPAFNPTPKDTAGAGDSFLTCSSMALLVGASIWQSAYLGSLAAACQVGRVGNLPLSVDEIEAEIDS